MNSYLNQIQELARVSKYTDWYVAIVARALHRAKSKEEANLLLGYTEAHHILPISFNLGGRTDSENLVLLTGREHFVVHRLMTKMFDQPKFKRSMYFALSSFHMNGKNTDREYINSRTFEVCRKALSAAMTGRLVTEETRDLMSKQRKGKPNGRKGLPVKPTGPCTDSRRIAISNGRKQTGRVCCIHCKTETDPGNHFLFHGDACNQGPNAKTVIKERSTRGRLSVQKAIAAGNHKNPKPPQGKFRCPYCPKEGTNWGSMCRFHYENCTNNPNNPVKERLGLPNNKLCCLGCGKETDLANFAKLHKEQCKKN